MNVLTSSSPRLGRSTPDKLSFPKLVFTKQAFATLTFAKFTIALIAFATLACSDDDSPTAIPKLTNIVITIPTSTIMVGQTSSVDAAGRDQHDDDMAVDAVEWSTSAPSVATVSATGVVTGVTEGTARIIATVGDVTGEQTVTVTNPPGIIFNEVESNGGTPGDWAELHNPTNSAVDLTGWVFKDDDNSHAYTLPAGSVIAAGGYLVLEEAAFDFGLGAPDSVRLYSPHGTWVAGYGWTNHATTTYGRCPDATGDFATTAAPTKGAANVCLPLGPVAAAWPGLGNDVETVDATDAFTSNLSGLIYEAANGSTPAILWAVLNGPGTLYRLVWNGTIWTSDTNNGWGSGKALHYASGLHNPDSEGVTYGESGSSSGIYVATERNNDSSTVSKNRILRFDPTQAGTALSATNEWDITSDLPVVGANLGIEAITWVPDSYLVSKNFYDESKSRTYNPADYPNHGSGLFFVGVEANGKIYAYALNHTNNSFTRIAEIETGFPGVMDLSFDRDTKNFWVTCDDGCNNKSALLAINTTPGSPTLGRFAIVQIYDAPSSMPNTNNEGFTVTPESTCTDNKKYVFWSDDNNLNHHAIRQATIPCGALP